MSSHPHLTGAEKFAILSLSLAQSRCNSLIHNGFWFSNRAETIYIDSNSTPKNHPFF